ncbi:ABC transporter ATP-binding protein [Thalassoroseus pseudoceratinae]|uniref:ABC transporter ATP-binding protein n=1 Tax=Thalassoroseus pseudoceratinae TaxID=2713176 RepID=UPI001F1019C0|nr:ATP-binding cassette domain-containing protein [Thalassoroseus pseudoceratinae]
MSVPNSIISVEGLGFRYPNTDSTALDDVSFAVAEGEIFGLLGPNGSGKTTLFRMLSTLLPFSAGQGTVCGFDLASQTNQIRRAIGVTFQSPSLDIQLTVAENLVHQARLYGLNRQATRNRVDELLERMRLTDRRRDLVSTLSGGLKRRVEIAKGLIHKPRVLLLDEPSTGLDPGARQDLWRYLSELASGSSLTILATTHLMDEAEQCDRLAILNQGQLVAIGSPDELRASIGGDCLTIECEHPERLASSLRERFEIDSQVLTDSLRISSDGGPQLFQTIMDGCRDEITSVTYGKPTLEDVFISRTGHRFWEGGQTS